jgi:hypothetical protein
MKARCHNPRHVKYALYGACGVTVCDEWRSSFVAFLDHVGLRPAKGYTIDRIDSAGNYEPGNVRWATVAQQNSNRRPYRKRQILRTADLHA